MKVIVTGKGGQLASEFEKIKGDDLEWKFLSVEDLDITNESLVRNFFKDKQIDVLINCAAYTAVDKAEDDIELAYAVNEKGVKHLIEACKKTNAKFIHYSTDYVFDGESSEPYTEYHKVDPQSIYGKSKLAGEELLRKEKTVYSIVIRTSWVYSNFGHNFVKTMLRLGKEKSELGVVADQVGSPTFAQDLAKDTLKAIEDTSYKWKNADIFHYSNEGSCSWYDFAKQIFYLAGIDMKLNSLSTVEFPTRAVRPKFSLLDKTKFKKTFSVEINDWGTSLRNMLKSEL
ncbi:dTDP-4-dehydrorhamnose reductase [Flavobacteriaceae bacterium]|nr:dTDP-4-dehydrorhamnose reductase [Flavobacteriaceae bacterium]